MTSPVWGGIHVAEITAGMNVLLVDGQSLVKLLPVHFKYLQILQISLSLAMVTQVYCDFYAVLILFQL